MSESSLLFFFFFCKDSLYSLWISGSSFDDELLSSFVLGISVIRHLLFHGFCFVFMFLFIFMIL